MVVVVIVCPLSLASEGRGERSANWWNGRNVVDPG